MAFDVTDEPDTTHSAVQGGIGGLTGTILAMNGFDGERVTLFIERGKSPDSQVSWKVVMKRVGLSGRVSAVDEMTFAVTLRVFCLIPGMKNRSMSVVEIWVWLSGKGRLSQRDPDSVDRRIIKGS
jgi:hypothetical protein